MLPTRGHDGDAGLDLYSDQDLTIPPNDRKLVSTGIAIKIPSDCYGRVAPRSGLACRKIDVGAGVIDVTYTGEVKVLLINNSSIPFDVKHGMPIAQLICERIRYPDIVEVEELEKTNRGSDGFGSTG